MNSQGPERDQCERGDFPSFAKYGVHVHVFWPQPWPYVSVYLEESLEHVQTDGNESR